MLVDLVKYRLLFFENGKPFVGQTFLRKDKIYRPSFCFVNGKVELLSSVPSELPEEYLFLIGWNEEIHKHFPGFQFLLNIFLFIY